MIFTGRITNASLIDRPPSVPGADLANCRAVPTAQCSRMVVCVDVSPRSCNTRADLVHCARYPVFTADRSMSMMSIRTRSFA
jgi:hypothetical protein